MFASKSEINLLLGTSLYTRDGELAHYLSAETQSDINK